MPDSPPPVTCPVVPDTRGLIDSQLSDSLALHAQLLPDASTLSILVPESLPKFTLAGENVTLQGVAGACVIETALPATCTEPERAAPVLAVTFKHDAVARAVRAAAERGPREALVGRPGTPAGSGARDFA